MADVLATTASPAISAQLGLLKYAIANVVAPVLVATFLGCILFGVLLYMVGSYFSRFSSADRLAFKLLVGVLTFTTLLDTMNQCAWAWRYTVEAALDPFVLAKFPRSLHVFAILTGINVLLAHAFFTWRLWVVSDRENWWLPSGMLLLELRAAVFGFVLAHRVSQTAQLADWGDVKWLLYTWLSAGVLCDILITGAIAYYVIIRSQRELGPATSAKLSRSNPLGRIVIKTMQTNAASLVVQVITLILTVVVGGQLWYTITAFQLSRIYVLSVLATLNARSSSHTSSSDPSPSSGSFVPRVAGPHSSFKRRHSSSAQRSRSASASAVAPVPVHVHVSREVAVDDDDEGDEVKAPALAHGPLELALGVPYAVRFERARERDKGEVELGGRS
ncbi:hypothetical protein JCM3775_006619 [Rhodotorula graminis]